LLKWVELEVVRDFLSKEKNEVMYSPLLKLIEKIPDGDTANKLKLTIIRVNSPEMTNIQPESTPKG
jgi:hypothetical protein